MKNLFTFLFLFSTTIIFGQFSPANVTPGVIYATTGTPDGCRLVTIDQTTGAITPIGNIEEFGTGTNFLGVHDLAVNAAGELYGSMVIFGASTFGDRLIRIDAATGQAELVGVSFIEGQASLAFDNNDVLWGAYWTGTNTAVNNIDVTTAAVTTINNNLPGGWWSGYAIHPTTGLIYAYRWSFEEIYTIDPATGAVTLVATLPAASIPGNIGDLFFDTAGDLFITNGGGNFGGSPSLYKVDLATETATLVGAFSGIHPNSGISGAVGAGQNPVAVVVNSIPTLGEWALIILFLLVVNIGSLALVYAPQMQVAGGSNISFTDLKKMDIAVNKNFFFKAWLGIVAVLTIILMTAGFGFGYEMTNADIPCGILASGFVAFWLQLMTKK